MPSSEKSFLAFDLGAESGRALLGVLRSGSLSFEEIHRFPNEAVQYNGEMHWDVARLWLEMQRALSIASSKPSIRLESMGVDAWGLDYAILGENGTLLENPYQYRDPRTDGIVEKVFSIIPANEVYARTGIQFMQVNALYQIYAASLKTPKLIQSVENFITIPDLFNFWLTGKITCEFTNATTTQMYDPRRQRWSTEILEALGLPVGMLTPVIQPGTTIAPLARGVAKQSDLPEIPVIAPACHDTGSAVAAIQDAGNSVYISSGTWSLLGTEISEPVINQEAQNLNFTNEGGVCGTIRLLKNIAGLWLLQCCRRDWQINGDSYSYAELTEQAASSTSFQSLIDPDYAAFLHPENMPNSIDRYCEATDQPKPTSPAAYTRAILESLAFKYRYVTKALERLTGRTYGEIHIVGGGAKNHMLNQFTANATGRRVIAGPIEATALGNIGIQMLATGAASSLEDVRRIIAASFPATIFEPKDHDQWNSVYQRYQQYCSPGQVRI